MVIQQTYLAHTVRSSQNLAEARQRVVHSYRQWIRAVPEIQTMYSLNVRIPTIRTKIRQEFERHRYASQLPVIDKLIQQSQVEFQETLNYWKQVHHVLKFFRAEEDPKARLPANFIEGFLEVGEKLTQALCRGSIG